MIRARAGAEEHDQRAGIHRMSDPGVRSGGDDFLAGGDFDGAGAVSVFLEDEKDDEKTERDQGIAEYDERERNPRPGKAAIEKCSVVFHK